MGAIGSIGDRARLSRVPGITKAGNPLLLALCPIDSKNRRLRRLVMKRFVATIVLAVTLLAGGSVFGVQFAVGVRIGPPPPPRVVRVIPARPGPDYIWVDG